MQQCGIAAKVTRLGEVALHAKALYTVALRGVR
jgi:hypothetical protein